MAIQYIFFYGTLMCPEVYSAVTGQNLVAKSGALEGYQIYSLKDRVYPGIKPAPNVKVSGLVSKVDGQTLDNLDWFEGSEYERKKVEVKLDSGELVECFCYILKSTHHHIIDHEEWDFQHFLDVNLANYLN
jgi:gamma-glutamylcyclotransferase (GGCT)/AIG2-like uncharacterized protein YtfP